MTNVTCVDSEGAVSAVRFTVADFNRMGGRQGFSYQLSGDSGNKCGQSAACVAEGQVRRFELRKGLSLVTSDLRVHQDYESTSLQVPHFSIIVLLQGCAQTQLAQSECVHLGPHGAVNALHAEPVSMTGVHPARQHLRSINLTIPDPQCLGDERMCDLMDGCLRRGGPRLQHWQVPSHLIQALEHMQGCDWNEPLADLLRESVMNQLLLHALAAPEAVTGAGQGVSPRDRQLLERVRERLHEAPGAHYTLGDLAHLACMSPSTLRAKFQLAYECSVFHWLRVRRMEVAREHLVQGMSVQQVAPLVGYRHASNFATAFREHFGMPPSECGH